MATSEYTSNGWDIIAAGTQDAINKQLYKIGSIPIKTDADIPLLGLDLHAEVDIELSPPQLNVKDGSGRMVDVFTTVSGSILVNGTNILDQAHEITMTVSLTQVTADLDPHPDGDHTNFDLLIDLANASSVELNIDSGPSSELALLTSFLNISLKKAIGDTGKTFKVASFTLANSYEVALQAAGLVPHTADFSFTKDEQTPGHSNLLVLMLSVSQVKGGPYFDKPLLPPDQDFMVLISNQILLGQMVKPAVVANIKSQASDPDSVDKQLDLRNLQQPFMYEIANNANIGLAQSHDPWIDTLTVSIDTDKQALCLYVDAKADVTFLNIHVDTWDRSWHKFNIDDKGNISFIQTNEDSGHSSDMEWWKWLIGVLSGGIALLIEGIIYAVVEDNVPSLEGRFADIGSKVVTWPGQQEVVLKSVELPNHVIFKVDVHF